MGSLKIIGGIWEAVREFFSEPKTVVLFVLLLLSVSSTLGTYAYSKYKDKMIEKAQKKLEDATLKFRDLRRDAQRAVDEYGKLSKIVDKELNDNEELKKKIHKKQKDLQKSIDKTNKEIDKMNLGQLADAFRKAGYLSKKKEVKDAGQ